jgi:hypothetical protein
LEEKERGNNWNAEQVMCNILEEGEDEDESWVGFGIPELTERIIDSYEEHGGMDQIGGKNYHPEK